MPFTKSKLTFGQVVIGPPGSGKTTYCGKIKEFLAQKCKREVLLVNLDPSNENMPYTVDIDVISLISVHDVMEKHDLGPNGAIVYCMEYLETNLDWLFDNLKGHEDKYILFDMPGQVELYTHNESVGNICRELLKKEYNLCIVNLTDSHHCSEPHKFISTLLMSLWTMLQIGLPAVNVLSKGDELKKYASKLDFNIDFYTEVLNLDYLLDRLNADRRLIKFRKLNEAFVSIIQDASLVSFFILDWQNESTVVHLKNEIDRVNGYVYGSGEERSIQSLLSCAVGAQPSFDYSDLINK